MSNVEENSQRSSSLDANASEPQPEAADEQVIENDKVAEPSDAIFSQLAVIQALQKEISELHLALETTSEVPTPAPEPAAATDTKHNDTKQQHQMYEQMRVNFDQKQTGILALTAKLSDLSAAIKQLHSLPPPAFTQTDQHGIHHQRTGSGASGLHDTTASVIDETSGLYEHSSSSFMEQ